MCGGVSKAVFGERGDDVGLQPAAEVRLEVLYLHASSRLLCEHNKGFEGQGQHLAPHCCNNVQVRHVEQLREHWPPRGVEHVVSASVLHVTESCNTAHVRM